MGDALSPDVQGLICAEISGMGLTPGNCSVQMSHVQKDWRAGLSKNCQEGYQESELNRLRAIVSLGAKLLGKPCAEWYGYNFSMCPRSPYCHMCHQVKRYLTWPLSSTEGSTHVCVCVCMSVYVHTWVSVNSCVCLCIHVPVCMYVGVFVPL